MRMNGLILIINSILCSVTVVWGSASLLTGQSQYAPEILNQLQASVSMEKIMALSLNTAIHACQNSFKWDRWDCPKSDFVARSSSDSLLVDHEDSYVRAIFTASVLYTITKKCSSGLIPGCDTCTDSHLSPYCSDNPQSAANFFRQYFEQDFQDNLNGRVAQHNYRAVAIVLEKSLRKQCICALVSPSGECSKEICIQALKPFAEIAADVRQMYEEALQLDNNSENSRILWHNIPLDALLYVKDSPQYCEADAILLWSGVRGRQCAATVNDESLTEEDLQRCRHLCHECGYIVVYKKIAKKNRCNCKLTWGFQFQCETCVTVEKQHFCY